MSADFIEFKLAHPPTFANFGGWRYSMGMTIRHNWTTDEVLDLLAQDLELLEQHAQAVHAEFGDLDIQQCELLSIKTGGCPEDCGYCAQSAHHKAQLTRENLLDVSAVLETAGEARKNGAERFCMGAAWKSVPKGKPFESLLKMIRGVDELGMEVCCTFGTANEEQLRAMKDAGLKAYNHNLDTSREHYPNIVSTRSYDERLETIAAAQRAGVEVCCGGILGMGESLRDRASLMAELGRMDPHPQSVPVNLLVPVEGTPLENTEPIDFEEFLRVVAVARIVMPRSRVRLSAGRNTLTEEQQLRCFQVGANSIFVGEKLLTTPNVPWKQDREMYRKLNTAPAAAP